MPPEEEYPQGGDEDEYKFADEDEYDLNEVKGEYSSTVYREDEYNLNDKKEDEYDLEDKKGDDEFNIESKGLDEFMTTVKQSAAPNFAQPAPQYNTTVPQHAPAASDFLFANPEPNPVPAAKAPVDEFDDLFGDKPIAPKPVASAQYMTYNQPAAPASNQFDSYYATYQQPAGNQGAYNPYGGQPQVNNPPKAGNPFDLAQSSYSEYKPGPAGGNVLW